MFVNGQLAGGGGGPSCLVNHTFVMGQPAVLLSLGKAQVQDLEKMKVHTVPMLGMARREGSGGFPVG